MNRIAFFGTSTVAVPILQSLAHNRNIKAVFCNPDRPKGRGRRIESPPVKCVAQNLGIPCYQPEQWRDVDTKKLWDSLNIDLAIVVSYGYILPSWVIDNCKLGVWNLHFSILPRWRGASPVNYAIMLGDDVTGVSLMRLTRGLDEGPILAQYSRPISINDDASSMLAILALDAANLLLENLSIMEEGQVILIPQDSTKATLAPKLNKNMARLNTNKSAIELHRQVRALQTWPGTELTVYNSLLKVCSVGGIRPDLSQPPGTLIWNKQNAWLTAGDSKALELTTLQRSGKAIQPASQTLQCWGIDGKTTVN
jgi:methionyl-tRNA formyltransferase